MRSTRNDPPLRRTGSHVSRPSVRRSTPLLSGLQILGLVMMVGSSMTVWALSNTPQAAGRRLVINGARFTSSEVISQIVGLDKVGSLFRLQPDRVVSALADLPAVVSATVEVKLPDTVVVTLQERTPRIVWVIGQNRFAATAEGLLFGYVDAANNPIPSTARSVSPAPTAIPPAPSLEPSAEASPSSSGGDESGSPEPTSQPHEKPKRKATPTPKPTPTPKHLPTASPTPKAIAPSIEPVAQPDSTPGPAVLSLPVVYDRQSSDAPLTLGSVIDSVSLDAGYRLASRTPAELGSKAQSLVVIVDDDRGFTVSSVPAGWVAEFGFYTPTVRKDTVIPQQIEDLRTLLLSKGENHVAWVWLMSDISPDGLDSYWPR